MGAAQAPIRGRGAPVPPGDERAGQPSRDGEERSMAVAFFALPAFLFGVVRVVRVCSYGPRPKHLEHGWLRDGIQGRRSGPKGRDTASLPWSPDPRPGPVWAWKGVWGHAPRRSARPTVGPSGARNEVRGGPRTEWRKGVEGRRPRGSRAAPWHVLTVGKV